jgi:Secretion system C-terminal sorting domain
MKGISGNYKYIIINNSINEIPVTLPAGSTGTYTTLAANPREYIVGNAIAPPLIYPTINLDNYNDDITIPNGHVPYKFTGSTTEGTSFTFKPYSITYISGAYPATCIIETLGGLCAPGMWTLGNKYTFKVANGVGPYIFTSNAAIDASGASLNVNTANDYVTLDAYRPTSLPATTNYNITFTAKDLGKGGATGTLNIIVKAKKSIDILNGSTTSSPSAGTTINACTGGCITLTASNIDLSTTNNRYQWYTVDGNKSFDSPGTNTYGDNGYSQTVTICPKQAEQKYYVIAYTGKFDCDFAIDEITIKTPVAQANPEINDATNLYVCNTSPGNAINLGNPTPLGASYTYLWTPVGSTTGTTISSTSVAQPLLTITSPSVTSVTYSVKVSLTSTCFNTSQITATPKKCCTTASDDLKFKPYSTMTEVIDAIQANANCTTCVDLDEKIVTNFDGTINFNGPIVHGIGEKNAITFKDCDNLQFSQEAYLSVRDGNVFILDNSKADACTNYLWKGLQAKTAMEGIKVLNGSSIKNAQKGIWAKNNASITAKNSVFDKNFQHMYFEGYGGNFSDISIDKGITGNTFTHSSGFLLAPYTIHDRTATSIYFFYCPGSLLIGGDPLALNTINNTEAGIFGLASGIAARNNTISNFKNALYSSDSRQYLNYLVQENSFNSNYYFTGTQSTVELNNYGTAIYITANSNITPDTISIKGNTITNCRQGIYVSKLNGKPLIVDLDGQYGGEIKQNTITLYKDPDAADDFTHKGMVLLFNNGIDVVKNDIKTDPTTFGSLSPQTKIDKYYGIQASNAQSSSDYFANTFTDLGKMITLALANDGFLQCNFFNKGAVNYPGINNTTGITGIEFQDVASINPQGAGGNGAGNRWVGFPELPTDYDRVRRTSGSLTPIGYLKGTPLNQNPNNTNVFTVLPAAVVCNMMQGLAEQNDDEQGQSNDDLAKDGGDEIDSLATYQTTYDSTETVTDLFADANQLLLALEAVAAGELDSMAVAENFANTAVYQVYTLETAMAAGDSSATATAISQLPKDIVGDNYKIVALINNKTAEWTALDSLDIEYVAYQRVDEGGPAVINARNILGIYLDDASIEPKSNRSRRNNHGGGFVTITPNPNNGSFILSTSASVGSTVKIYDSLGQLTNLSMTTEGATSLTLENLHSGLYHLAVIDFSGKVLSTSFVIN